jgi:hypothetical protein
VIQLVERAARSIAGVPDERRRRAWSDYVDRTRAAASTTRERELALQVNALVTTRVRELCEIRRARVPWDIPPPERATSTRA